MATETEIYNLALGKVGGAGDVNNGNAFIASIDGTDLVSAWGKLAFPRVRRRVISDLATSLAPFRSTVRFADLSAALTEGETPEIGAYTHAFNLPGDCLTVVRQFLEDAIATRDRRAYRESAIEVNFQWDVVANKAGSGKILLTDTLSNSDVNSAFIEHVIDTPNTGGFTEGMIDCIATLLASEVCPVIGRDIDTADRMLLKYEQISKPFATRENLAGFNHAARTKSNYRGGRSRVIGSL